MGNYELAVGSWQNITTEIAESTEKNSVFFVLSVVIKVFFRGGLSLGAAESTHVQAHPVTLCFCQEALIFGDKLLLFHAFNRF